MNQKAITIEDFEATQRKQNYKYICLKTMTGDSVIPFNTNKIGAAERLKQIKTRLDALPENVYLIEAKSSLSPKAIPDTYFIAKDQQLAATQPHTVIVTQSEDPLKTENVRSYEYVLSLETKCARLELENAALQKDIERLEGMLDEAELLSEEASENTQPGWVEWLKQTAEQVIPIFDERLKLQNRRLDLMERNLQLRAIALQSRVGTPPAPPTPSAATDSEPTIDDYVRGFIESQENPEVMEDLTQLYNAAESMDGLFTAIKDYDAEVFGQLVVYLNPQQ